MISYQSLLQSKPATRKLRNDGDIMDMRKYVSKVTENKVIIEDIPDKIEGTYQDDYNILYVDDIIRKKLNQEKHTELEGLKNKYNALKDISSKPQTYIVRERTMEEMKKIELEIAKIENGEKIKLYEESSKDIIAEYRKNSAMIKTVTLDMKDEEDDAIKYVEDKQLKMRANVIDRYLTIASNYITLNIVKINNFPNDICNGCGISLANIVANEEGTIRCPNIDCQTEHDDIIMNKLATDGTRININTYSKESIENFMKAFIRYQGLQTDRPPDSVYIKLDNYFRKYGKPLGEEIRNLPLNDKGRRGNTDHKMLWNALKEIDSNYFKHANLIGHVYWGWTLPNVMHLKEIIIRHYNITQAVFYQIPIEERGRISSIGTSYRLWRHLQLVGHECYVDEFKIVTNHDSLRRHDTLWKRMTEGADDPEIYYIN